MAGAVAVLAIGIWWWVGLRHEATPAVVEGWAMPNGSGDAIHLVDSGGTGYSIAGAMWSGPDGVTHPPSNRPTCIGTDTSVKKRVQLGVVDIDDSEFGGWSHVVWVKCLD
ncbi:hypothetical protein [Kibdelosporangium persicum]|nr:hypothetical protein [Kibdelosporangium persicum]